MTQDEIDTMWQQAMRQSIEKGEMFTRYHFAKMVADKAFQSGYEKGIAAFNEAVELEREACAKVCDGYIGADPIAAAIRARGEAIHPQRTWVDLTRTQMQDVYFEVLKEHRGGHQIQGQLAFGEALQAKIREKNT
jgi:lysozyme family protein